MVRKQVFAARASIMLLLSASLCAPLSELRGQTKATRPVRLRPGQTVRVWLADGPRFEAQLIAVDSSPVVLRFLQPGQAIPITVIDSLWLRRRATGRGALIGGIVLGGGSFAFLTFICRAIGEGECNAWGAVVGLSLAGAGAGALLGAGIGSLIPTWQRLDPKQVTVSLGVGNLGWTAAARIHF